VNLLVTKQDQIHIDQKREEEMSNQRMIPLLNYKHILQPKDTNKEKNSTSKSILSLKHHIISTHSTFQQTQMAKKGSERSREINQN